MNTLFNHQQRQPLIVCGDLPVAGISPCLRHLYSNKQNHYPLSLKQNHLISY